MKRFLILIGVFLMALVHSALSADFDVGVIPIKDKIVIDEIAEFNITIFNNFDTNEEFTIKKTGYPYWDMYTPSFENPISIRIKAHGSASIRLLVDPLYITSVDTYTLEVGVIHEKTQIERKAPVTVGIKSIDPLIDGYLPNVLATATVAPDNIDPRFPVSIMVSISNQNPVNYSNLTINLKSRLFNEVVHIPLHPQDDKVIELPERLDKMTPPQKDSLELSIYKDSRVIVSPVKRDFQVGEYAVKEELPEETSFLKGKKGFRYISNNPAYTTLLEVETNSFKKIFTATSPEARFEERNGRKYFVWRITLESDRTKAVYIMYNYRPLIVIFGLIVIAILFYFVFRGPIVVTKGVVNIITSNGGVSDLKAVIRVKNRGSKELKNIEIMDSIPHIGHVEKELSVGSMQPHAIVKHPKKGVIIKFNIESLEAGDERVLSYRMKSRLPILGSFTLPHATARCKAGNKLVISNSNRPNVVN